MMRKIWRNRTDFYHIGAWFEVAGNIIFARGITSVIQIPLGWQLGRVMKEENLYAFIGQFLSNDCSCK